MSTTSNGYPLKEFRSGGHSEDGVLLFIECRRCGVHFERRGGGYGGVARTRAAALRHVKEKHGELLKTDRLR
jgi:hypothetical protein